MAEVNRREIYRYLGIKGQQEPDPQTKDLVEDCLGELERSVNCRSFYRRYPLTLLPDSELDFTCFKAEAAEEGLYLRPRFSPGYGDLPLSCQPDFCRVLEAEKTVGITLTESFLMMPSKSVTAVIGVSKIAAGCVKEGCEVCSNKNCLYRRDK